MSCFWLLPSDLRHESGQVLTLLLVADTRTVLRHSFEAHINCACSLCQTAAVTNSIRVKIIGPIVKKSWHLPIFELSLMSKS